MFDPLEEKRMAGKLETGDDAVGNAGSDGQNVNLNEEFWSKKMPENMRTAKESSAVDSEEEAEPVDAKVEVRVTPDKMEAMILLIREENGGEPITEEMISNALALHNIQFGILEEKIEQMAKHPWFDDYIVIAEGIRPEDGVDGMCKNCFELERHNQPKERGDGSVNFFELDLVQNVQKGTVISKIIAETEGTEGCNVYNEVVLQKKGKAMPIPMGKNTMLSEDGGELLAACEGNLLYQSGKFNVEQIFEVKGDVDISTGNINFLGDVVITGDVREGFTVQAKGNILVKGMIEGAEIVSGGHVVVTGGMNGSNRGKITCKGDLKCKYLENAIIKCRGNITSEYIVNSEVMCDGEIELAGNRGLLIGGNYVVLKKITAKTIGSPSHVPTMITLGAYGTILEEKKTLDAALSKNEKETAKIMQIIDFLTEKKKELGKLPDDKDALLRDAVRTKMMYILERSKLMKQLEALLGQLEYEGTHSLSCSKTMHPGTKITIKRSTFIADREYAFCTIYYDEDKGEIVVSPMR